MRTGKFFDKIKKLPVLRMLLNGTFTASGTFFSVVFVIILAVIMLFSHSKVTLGDTALEASAVLVSPVEILLEDVDSVTLGSLEDFELGTRTRGISNLFTLSGSFTNPELGIYDIYISKQNKDNYILIRYWEECYLVVNEKTPDGTEALYEQLSESIGSE